MNRIAYILVSAAVVMAAACTTVKDPIKVESPTPKEQITKVTLDETQQGYVQAGNGMAFRFLDQMFEGKDLVLSPLSLQYALSMAANGASGETLQEIIDFLGYGEEGIDALNAYCKILLEQLPAVDLNVTLKLTDALLVNELYPLLDSFRKTVQDCYYAAVENMPFSDAEKVAARINEWAKRNTNGFIDKMMEASDISPTAAAYLMNALYFKAKWQGSEYDPMFEEYSTSDFDFTLSNGSKRQLPMMQNMRHHSYAEMDGYKVLALPYEDGKFFMYILLPDENDLGGLLKKLTETPWKTILSSFKHDAEVYVRLPKFDIENKFILNDALKELGVKKAFEQGIAEFGSMFSPEAGLVDVWINKVIQKARISVAEWGTEAAAVTVVAMNAEGAALHEDPPKRVYFYADHPFVFIIGESTSGTILFEGTFTGK